MDILEQTQFYWKQDLPDLIVLRSDHHGTEIYKIIYENEFIFEYSKYKINQWQDLR